MSDRVNVGLIRIAAERLAQSPVPSTNAFYARLFEAAPSVRPLFPEDMFTQSEKLWKSIVAVVEYVEDLEALRPVLRDMGARHVHYGAEPAHYAVVAQTLVETLADIMGPSWSEDQEKAWTHVLGQVAEMMIEGAHENAA